MAIGAGAGAGRRGAQKSAAPSRSIFGMTFPYSTHNYQLRFWMAAGGVDPDEDVRLVVLPPPYMVDSLASGHVEGFCVGAPWNSVAVDLGIGRILHFVSDILARAAEKVLALRGRLGGRESGSLVTRAGARACVARPPLSKTTGQPRRSCCDPRGAGPDRRRRRGDPPHARGAAEDRRRTAPIRASDRYMHGWRARARLVPIPRKPRWLYAQMVRWGQTPFSAETLWRWRTAVFRPDLYDAAARRHRRTRQANRPTGIGAFTGPAFDPHNIDGASRRTGASAGEIGR